MGDPQEKSPDHPQAELDLSHVTLAQWWDDEQFRPLKISVLSHSATGATNLKIYRMLQCDKFIGYDLIKFEISYL